MKRINIAFWIVNILFGAFMIFSAIPDIMQVDDAVQFMSMLGYPTYFTPFIGVAKVIGVIAILIPGYPRIKEWAYAGLCFDLIGATYSVIAIGTPVKDYWMMFLFLGLAAAAYILYRKKLPDKLLCPECVMIEVFKTTVNSSSQANVVREYIRKAKPGYDVHFDLGDCDKILRVENSEGSVEAELIIRLLNDCDCAAEILPGEVDEVIKNNIKGHGTIYN